MTTLSKILEYKIVAILRNISPSDTLNIANALYDGGIRILEVTLNSKDSLQVIEQLADEFKQKLLVGAGTVLNTTDVANALNAGASFIISPALDMSVIKATKNAGAVSIPGAFTPTEILSANNNGADIVKVFPALNAAYISNILAPLNHIRLMPTGGLDEDNIKDFAATGAVAFGIGSALVSNKAIVNDGYLQQLTAKASRLTAAITTKRSD